MKTKHILAIALIAAVGATSTPSMAAKRQMIKLKPAPAATVKIHCIQEYLRHHSKPSIKFTRIMNNWLEIYFKKDVSDSDADELLNTAKVNCGVEADEG